MGLAHITAHDSLGLAIKSVVKLHEPMRILDIGSSDGSGSVSTFLKITDYYKPQIYCIEMDEVRFEALVKLTKYHTNAWSFCLPTVPTSCVLSEKMVRMHYAKHREWDCWRSMGLLGMLDWRKGTERAINGRMIQEGIDYVKQSVGGGFDMVLIDGGDFTGNCELARVYGAKIIILDDVKSMKNYDNSRTLSADPDYRLIASDMNYRNGYMIYEARN